MDRTQSRFVQLTVKFESRSDGGLRVFSDDLPELVLSHRDRTAVLADIKPALEVILSAKLGCMVTVEPLRSLSDVLDRLEAQDFDDLDEEVEDAPPDLPVHLLDQSYLVHCD